MSISPEEFILGTIHLQEDAALWRAFTEQHLEACFNQWRREAIATFPNEEEVVLEEGVAARAGVPATDGTQCSIMGCGVGSPPPHGARIAPTASTDGVASLSVPSTESPTVFHMSWVERDGQMAEMQTRIEPQSDAALAMRYAMLTFRPGAVRVTPENSESGQEEDFWRDPTNWRIPARPTPVPSWYDTLPDDTACSLEEWNAKVDALLDDVAEFHRAIDGEDGEAE